MSSSDTEDDRRRGRSRFSDSSRESSSERPKKQLRSFSPTSDDGLVVPQVADNDTPPPPDRPLIRQAVGFSWESSTLITGNGSELKTYTASIPSSTTHFLPGQEVISGTKSPPLKRRRAKKTPLNEEFASKTGKFRLDPTYRPPVFVEPAEGIPTNSGPYKALFRAGPGNIPAPTFRKSKLTDITTLMPSVSPPLAMVPFLQSAAPESNSSPAAQHEEPQSSMAAPSFVLGSSTIASGMPSAAHNHPAHQATNNPNQASQISPQQIPLSSPPSQSNVSLNITTPQSIDHGWGNSPNRLSFMVSSGSTRMSSLEGGDISQEGGSRTPQTSLDCRLSNGQTAGPTIEEPTVEKTRGPVRLITLLIKDIRSGVVDRQLAEVKVPLKPADNPEDGFWADGKEICNQLQNSPSRIEGPAKVWAFRGPYRQFLLRITGQDWESISTNVVVDTGRTLDLFVEPLPNPTVIPPPPQLDALELSRSPTPEIDVENPAAPTTIADTLNAFRKAYQQQSGTPPPSYSVPLRKAQSSTEQTDIPRRANRNPDYVNTSARAADTENERTDEPYMDGTGRRPLPPLDQDPELLRSLIVKTLDPMLQQEPQWAEWFQWRAAPERVSEILKQYRWLHSLTSRYIGRTVHIEGKDYKIEPFHIACALQVPVSEAKKFVLDCGETLRLLELYGPDGTRTHDPRVVDMIQDTSRPEYNSKPIKRFLRLLREVDSNWKLEHPQAKPGRGGKNRI